MSSKLFSVQKHTLPCTHIREWPRATAGPQEDVLHLAIKQYTPRDNTSPRPGDITIIGAHANGFPKELYEPLWDEVYKRLKATNIRIRSIWIADVAHQGASSVLNESKLGNDPSWYDHPRDLLNMINHFRAQMPRPLVGIGHSMGGAHLVNLSLIHARLFETLILMDPVLIHTAGPGNTGPARASTVRRDRWPSRAAAAQSYRKSKFYQAWDPRVLDLWLEHGLRALPTAIYPDAAPAPAPTTAVVVSADPGAATPALLGADGPVTLTTTKHQEVFTFMRPVNEDFSAAVDADGAPVPLFQPESLALFWRLPHVRPSVLYMFGTASFLSAPAARAEKMATTGTAADGSGGALMGRVKEVVFEGVGHLIPMEVVGRTADECVGWLVPELRRWERGEEEHRRTWGAVPRGKRSQMSDLFVKTMMSDWTGPGAPVSADKAKL